MASTLFAAFLILFMQAGFGLLATGLCRAKNAAHTMAMHLLVPGVVTIGFFGFGYALMGDGSVRTFSSHWIFHHSRGYFLSSDKADPDALAWFLLMTGYAAVAAAIPTGALAERWSLKGFFAFTFIVGAILFPIFGCWVWNGGWLAQLGVKAHLGHGAVDYAGSSVVDLLGGTLAFVLTWFMRPRIGKYDENGRPRPILGHHVPMVMLGALLLAFCWFGFTAARSFAANDGRAALIAVNTLLAGAGGALAAAIYMWFFYGRPDPSLTCNGLLAGLVSICASCAFVAPWAAFFIGVIGGVIAVGGVLLCERRGIDDPVGATSVFGLGGIWGMFALGLFADGSFGDQYNGVAGNIRGVFYGGGGNQLLCQLIAIAACIAWASIAGGAAFIAIDRLLRGSRVPPEVEVAGLDIPEMGAPGYPEFITHVAPESSGVSQINSTLPFVG
jgi:ammonium transporter, Amt family